MRAPRGPLTVPCGPNIEMPNPLWLYRCADTEDGDAQQYPANRHGGLGKISLLNFLDTTLFHPMAPIVFSMIFLQCSTTARLAISLLTRCEAVSGPS